MLAMAAHAGDADVQIHACGAMGNLAIDDNTTAIAAAGGIDVVLTAMTTYLGHEDVQVAGRRALDNFTISDNKMANAVTDGIHGIRVMLSAMTAHMDHAVVQEHGCAALHIFAQPGGYHRSWWHHYSASNSLGTRDTACSPQIFYRNPVHTRCMYDPVPV